MAWFGYLDEKGEVTGLGPFTSLSWPTFTSMASLCCSSIANLQPFELTRGIDILLASDHCIELGLS